VFVVRPSSPSVATPAGLAIIFHHYNAMPCSF
jgi:hypothetical protein